MKTVCKNQRFKLFCVKWPPCSGFIPDFLTLVNAFSSHHPPQRKKKKKKKNKPGKQGLVLKFDSIEIKVLSLAGIQTDPNFAQCFFGNCSGIRWISVFVRIEKQTANLSHWYKQNKEGKRALIYLEGKVRAYTCVCVCIDICRHWGLTDRFWRPM